LIFFWWPNGFWIFFWATLPLFSGLYHHVPVSWNSSSCSLFSSLIAAMTSLNAPFRRFPSTMWSGSALSRTPYLSLLVDNVTWRTLSSYTNTPREKNEATEQPSLTAVERVQSQGLQHEGSPKSEDAHFLCGCVYELSDLPALQEQINPETILQQQILSSSSVFRQTFLCY